MADDELLLRFGRRVRALRTERGWTLQILADAADLSVRFVSEIEAGRGNVSLTKLAGLAEAFGVPVAALLDGAAAPGVIALVGLRGAGKSSIGKKLAGRLDLPFFELDALIEASAGLSLAEVFAIHGESYYRRLETETLDRFLREHEAAIAPGRRSASPLAPSPRPPPARSAILATGGGIVTNPDAYERLKRGARVVWLKARPEDHWERVVKQGDRRPMAVSTDAQAELKRLLRAREPLYRQAHEVADTSQLGLSGTVDHLARTLA